MEKLDLVVAYLWASDDGVATEPLSYAELQVIFPEIGIADWRDIINRMFEANLLAIVKTKEWPAETPDLGD